MQVKIYALLDPRTCKVRYIGRTKQDRLIQRLHQHITKARYCERYGRRVLHKHAWIRQLLNEGLKPKIKLLCIVEGWEESHQVEIALIERYKESRNLVNHDDRGPGELRNVKDSTKEKISNTLKEKLLR